VNVTLAPTASKPTPNSQLAQHKTDLMSSLGANKAASAETFITAVSAAANDLKQQTITLTLTAALPAPNEVTNVTALQRLVQSLQMETQLLKAQLEKTKR
jgi:hypothetical protein